MTTNMSWLCECDDQRQKWFECLFHFLNPIKIIFDRISLVMKLKYYGFYIENVWGDRTRNFQYKTNETLTPPAGHLRLILLFNHPSLFNLFSRLGKLLYFRSGWYNMNETKENLKENIINMLIFLLIYVTFFY